MSKVILYTFKSFPYKNLFNNYTVFEFHKLRSDILEFEKLLNTHKPIFVVGIAKSLSESTFETIAVNIFNRTKSIDKNSINEYKLDYPKKGFKSIKVNHGYTDSFCNWTMFKVSKLILNTETKLQFIHVSSNDSKIILEYLKNLEKLLHIN